MQEFRKQEPEFRMPDPAAGLRSRGRRERSIVTPGF
jgi:hypothetical protein